MVILNVVIFQIIPSNSVVEEVSLNNLNYVDE
jgi:hypothetical protein